ncbi:hypothetical protein C8J57DRAFT_1491833 [Mycena rebaudengoi]|nr:hypothetical protein C8J57DRAFT_1491833 [Mycena rebaudengoi]
MGPFLTLVVCTLFTVTTSSYTMIVLIAYVFRTLSRIDLGNATADDLKELSAGCQKTTFGVGQTDTLDEAYRKAGKMDLNRFAARLDVVSSGLLEAISPDILQGQNTDADNYVRAEMYKLNVYGSSSESRIVLQGPPGHSAQRGHDRLPCGHFPPTAHAGSALTLEHDGTAWTFDSATQLATAAPAPALAYVAFYNDVVHAVAPHRQGTGAPRRPQAFAAALRTLLADRTFLPAGGFLAYGLTHQYPMPAPPPLDPDVGRYNVVPRPTDGRLDPVLRMLKGGGARIRTVSERVGLATRVSGETYHLLTGRDVLNTERLYDDDAQMVDIVERTGTVDYEEWPYTGEEVLVHWVTRIMELNHVGSSYLAYGNEPSLGHVYGNAALFVRVPAFGDGVRAAEAEVEA